MPRLSLRSFVWFLVFLAWTVPAVAQGAGTVYVRVEAWDVKREMWSAFEKNFEKYDQSVYEKLFKDGVIIEWGLDSQWLHNPQGYTHSTWYSTTSMEAMEKVDAAFEAAGKARGEEQQARLDAEFAKMLNKHRDYLIRQEYQKAKGVRLDKAFFYRASVAVKTGEGSSYASHWNEYVKPTFQKLMDEGVIVAYGHDVEEFTTESQDSRGSWYVVKDLAGHDKAQAALRDTWDRLSEEQRRARWASIWEFVVPGSYREEMTHIRHWAIKEY